MYIIQFLNNFLHKFAPTILPHRLKEEFFAEDFLQNKTPSTWKGFSSFDFCLRKHYLMFAKYLIVLTIWDV